MLVAGFASTPLHHSSCFFDLLLPHRTTNDLFYLSPSVLAYQQPNAKKLRRSAQRAEQLAAKGVVPRRRKQLLNRRPVDRTAKKAETEANNNPGREYYDIWGQECECHICMCLSSDDPILALPVFPSWECEDNTQELRRLLCEQPSGNWGYTELKVQIQNVNYEWLIIHHSLIRTH